MKYFKPHNTVGSRLTDSREPIGTEEELLKKKLENAELMQKDNIGRIFSPLNKAGDNALHKSNKIK